MGFTQLAFTVQRRRDGDTLNQQAGRVEHLPLVTVGPARVRPSVISGDAEDGQAAVVDLKRYDMKLSGGTTHEAEREVTSLSESRDVMKA